MIEILIVMGLLAIVASFALIMNLDDYRGTLFRNERDLVVSVLQKARSEAVNNVCLGAACTDGLAHGIHFTPAAYIVFQGTVYNAADATNQSIEANDKLQIIASAPDVVFTQLSGEVAAAPWNVEIKDGIGHDVFIKVNEEGQIDY